MTVAEKASKETDSNVTSRSAEAIKSMPLHSTGKNESVSTNPKVDQFRRDIEILLQGSSPSPLPPQIEKHYATSNSRFYASKEDIKLHHREIIRNPLAPLCVEYALREEEGSFLSKTGALVVTSGAKTGRSPKDKRIVFESSSSADVWWGPVNMPIPETSFAILRERAIDYLNTQKKVYVVDAYAGWDSRHRIKIRILCARAYHALFIQNMLVKPTDEELADFEPDFTIYNAGAFPANRWVEGVSSSCSVCINIARGEMIILGTEYAGEMKKGILSLMMFLAPGNGHLCLHSSANLCPKSGDCTMFFGLSGTGKTTLSADESRILIGDDEHIWTDTGIFNVEGGCYAKCIGLSQEKEPVIFGAVRFGAVVENVIMDKEKRTIDFEDSTITQNTRCAYPLQYVTNALIPAVVDVHPTNVILLTCDGFGVLPLVSKLTKEQVIYHFLMGYTSKMAGTETDILKPTAAFSSCYGEPFLTREPIVYAKMLAEKLTKHNATAFLLNTGWVGGTVGIGGNRVKLSVTRAIVDAIHDGSLAKQEFTQCPVFKLWYPKACPGVPEGLLDPSTSWKSKPEFVEAQRELAIKFSEKFACAYDAMVDDGVRAQGPTVA